MEQECNKQTSIGFIDEFQFKVTYFWSEEKNQMLRHVLNPKNYREAAYSNTLVIGPPLPKEGERCVTTIEPKTELSRRVIDDSHLEEDYIFSQKRYSSGKKPPKHYRRKHRTSKKKKPLKYYRMAHHVTYVENSVEYNWEIWDDYDPPYMYDDHYDDDDDDDDDDNDNDDDDDWPYRRIYNEDNYRGWMYC